MVPQRRGNLSPQVVTHMPADTTIRRQVIPAAPVLTLGVVCPERDIRFTHLEASENTVVTGSLVLVRHM
jgi:hypothetical protein